MDSNCNYQILNLLMNRFLTDSSGTYTEYKAVSIGAGSEGATDMLKDLYRPVRSDVCFLELGIVLGRRN